MRPTYQLVCVKCGHTKLPNNERLGENCTCGGWWEGKIINTGGPT